ncbi:MAG: zinc-dependent metalloprotease [Bacteroidales bacterium]|nr:zinc-dependent metalloprotease [Bacteroidales bacterium]
MVFNKRITTALIIALCIAGTTVLSAQRPNMRVAAKQQTQENSQDTAKKAPEKSPLTIDKFIKPGTRVMKGLTPVIFQDGRYFLTINDSLIGRDILMVTRISKAAEGIRTDFTGYAGDDVNSAVFKFEKGPNNKIFLTNILGRERVKDSTSAMFQSVLRSNVNAIIATFEIKAESADKSDRLIDVTDLFSADSEILFFPKGGTSGKTAFKLGGLVREASYISSINTYPINTEVKSVKTYGRSDGGTATYELNNSFVLLPKVPMTAIYADDRVGYFTENYTDFSHDPQGVKRISMITRFRLEPKPEDVEKYKRGELVEPAKPIVFYIDPSTPEEWVPYLIQGVNDWQVAFEKAGFKNAIYALKAPSKDKDSTWSLEDARFCAIVYKPSNTPNASGPHVSDPRSGEIIESHINWYHNVMSLVRNWYLIQCSPVDPAARKMTFDTELMGQLIRFVSSHEVGHTLGLRHNFAGTALYTAEQLRDTAFLRANGHTTSIMDYSRFNYVAQPGDNIPRELLFPRINHYDLWAIEWGYRRFPDIDDPAKERSQINKWIIEKTQDKRFKFGTESSSNDPRFQSEDLGENQMKTNELGIKNLKFVMDGIGEWTKEPNEDYENLRTMHTEVNNQFRRYIGHVVKWIGGVYQDSKSVEESGDVYTIVEKERQQEAMDFLNRHLFENPPLWLIPNEYMNKFVSRPEMYIERAYTTALSSLMSKRVIMNLASAEKDLGKNAYTLEDMFGSLDKVVWANKVTNTYDRILQKLYVVSLCDLFTGANAVTRFGPPPPPTSNPKDITEASSVAYYKIIKTLKYLKGIKVNDFNSEAHYAYLIRYMENILSATK